MKNVVKSSILAGIATLFMLFPSIRESSLKDITKPYTGIYQCTEARLGDNDYLDKLEELALELKTDGEFILYYAERNGERKTETGKYVYNKERKTITLIGGIGSFLKREFPLENGELIIEAPIAEKNLLIRFKQK